jgi:hypothetical protein
MRIVRAAVKRSRLLAACCMVLVMNGGGALALAVRVWTETTR